MTGEVLPFFLSLAALAIAALLIDLALHLSNLVWIERYLGILGTLLILGSFGYSMRRRKLIKSGNLAALLRLHEYMAWVGSLMILVHGGIHFNSILGWLAVWAMLVNVASGLTGKFLLNRARRRMTDTRQSAIEQGTTTVEWEQQVYWNSLTFDVVKQWRAVHFPITLAFSVLALGHIAAVLIFWGWK